MRFLWCLVLALFFALSANAESYATTLLWTSKSVLGENSETTVAYETVRFGDLWNAVLGQFAKGESAKNSFFPPTKDTAEVFVVFLSNNHELWQFSGDTSASQPLRTAFKDAGSKRVYNNIRVDGDGVISLVTQSLKEAGVDASFVGKCPGMVEQSSENDLEAILKKEGTSNTKVVVICGDGVLSHEMGSVGHVDKLLKESGVGYVMMFVTELDASVRPSDYSNAQRRRTLKQVSEDEMKMPINYTGCDNLCRTRVKFLEGIVLSLILALALAAGLCCLNILDSPTQFEKPEDTES